MRREYDEYERRMLNWRRWRETSNLVTGDNPSIYSILASGIYNRTDPRHREVTVPMLVGEAQDTERAVRTLPPALRRAVEVWYLERGGMHRKANSCGCRRETLLMRLDVARSRILAALEQMREARLEQERRLGA